MKYLLAAAAILSLAACTSSPEEMIYGGDAGNPDRTPYAGSPGSTYDMAANPPAIVGVVFYNPTIAIQPQELLDPAALSSYPLVMAFRVRYHRGDTPVGDDEPATTLEEARALCEAKAADPNHKADIATIFRITVTGSEELEESRSLHA